MAAARAPTERQFALRAQRPCNTLWQAGAAAGSWFTCALHGLPPELARRQLVHVGAIILEVRDQPTLRARPARRALRRACAPNSFIGRLRAASDPGGALASS